MNWFKNLNDALDYIEDHMKENLDFKEVAMVAYSSYSHFSRTFYMLSGISLSEYIRKRRLTLSATEVMSTDLKIIDIAFMYQYSTPESFSKAFKEFHGVSPRDARNQKGTLNSFSKLSFKLDIGGLEEVNYKLVNKDNLNFTGYSINVNSKEGQNFIDIPKLWQDVMNDGRFQQLLPHMDEMGVVGICYDFNMATQDFKYMIGVRNADLQGENLVEVSFDEQTFAAFEAKGKLPESVQKTTKHIYQEWFPSSNYEHTGGPEFEVYPQGDPSSEDYMCYYWVPIKQK